MRQSLFEKKHTGFMQEFEQLLIDLEERKTSITTKQYVTYPKKYRKICDLQAIAKKRRYSAYLLNRLNDLALRGHQILYKLDSKRLSTFVYFIFASFPALIRKEYKLFWLATLLLYGPAIILGLIVFFLPEAIYTVFDSGSLQMYERMYDPSSEHYGMEREAENDLYMFAYYVQNNISVGFNTFAGGLLAGFGTVFFLVYNGVIFGALAAHLIHLGHHEPFFSFIIGHCSIELTAIVIAGMAGLKIGYSLIKTGDLSRADSLKLAAKTAIKLVFGMAIMLFLAAFVEAFWSSLRSVEPSTKYWVGACLWLLVAYYFTFAGRYHES